MASTHQSSTGRFREVLAWVRTGLVALAVVLVPRTVLCQPFTIPSASMEPTLQVGDYILVSKFAYGWSRHSLPFSPPVGAGRLLGREPRRGDVVVFKKPADGRTDIIKRLIGLPGDRVQIRGGQVLINGLAVPRQLEGGALDTAGRPFPVSTTRETLPGGRSYLTQAFPEKPLAEDTSVYLVPQGCFFVMGDNRDNSLDSRFDPGPVRPGYARCGWDATVDAALPAEFGMGFVPAENLVGRAERVLVSWAHESPSGQPWNPLSHIRWSRTFQTLSPAKAG
jgi:signal peptidase I